jgi:hypothetical protein
MLVVFGMLARSWDIPPLVLSCADTVEKKIVDAEA